VSRRDPRLAIPARPPRPTVLDEITGGDGGAVGEVGVESDEVLAPSGCCGEDTGCWS
jgi:hypothetical protein